MVSEVRCPKCGRPSDARHQADWCSHCVLLLHDPWLTTKCPHCHRSATKDVGQFAIGSPPGTGEWRHAGFLLPYGGPTRAASLIQHYDAGHPIYDLGATPDLTPEQYAAVVERFRQRPDVQGILGRVAPHCLPPGVPRTAASKPPPQPSPPRTWLDILRRLRSGRRASRRQ